MDQLELTLLILVLFLIFFSALWLGITTLLVRLSGWQRLAERYPDKDDTARSTLLWQTGAIGRGPITGVSFRNALNFAICGRGLRVSIMKMLAPFAAPIFVPWDKITTRERKVLAFTMWDLHFAGPDELRLMVTRRAGEKLVQRSEGALKPPS